MEDVRYYPITIIIMNDIFVLEVSSSSQSALHSDFPQNPDEHYAQLEERILKSMQYSRYFNIFVSNSNLVKLTILKSF